LIDQCVRHGVLLINGLNGYTFSASISQYYSGMMKKRNNTDTKPDSYLPYPGLRHYRKEKNPGKFSKSTNVHGIESYYVSLFNLGCLPPHIDCDCFALLLAKMILSVISENNYFLTTQGTLTGEFYKVCLERSMQSGLIHSINDTELMIIYIKQMVLLLHRARLIILSETSVRIVNSIDHSYKLYMKIFKTFWNKSSWGSLFPSYPSAARELKKNRSLLKDILLASGESAEIERISNEFFELTGFCRKNDLLMISFLDFYFFTWLKHFGIIRYCHSGPDSTVSISLTPAGRKILTFF